MATKKKAAPKKKKLPGKRPFTEIVQIAKRIKRRESAWRRKWLPSEFFEGMMTFPRSEGDLNRIIEIATSYRGQTGQRETAKPFTVTAGKRARAAKK